jgi:TonB family protein
VQSTPHDANLAALQASTGLPGHVVDVVIVTGDAGLLATLREASGAELAIWHAPSADAAVDLLVGGRCGILIGDLGTLRSDASALLERLNAQFPELILLATGRREEEGAVASLISNGTVYRFLHKPVSPARASLFLTAATRRHNELRNVEPATLGTARTMAMRPHLGKIIAAIAAVLVIAIAFTVWSLREASVPTPIVQQQVPAPSRDEEIADHLARAEMAFATGRLSEPRGDNALEHFRAVLAVQPDRAEARTGVDRVINALEARVVAALQARNAPQGALAWTALQRAQPDHPDLPGLQAQLVSISRSMKPVPSTPPASPTPTSAAVTPAVKTGPDEARQVDVSAAAAGGSAAVAGGSAAVADSASGPEAGAPAAAAAEITDAQPAPAAPLAPSAEEVAAITVQRERGALIEPAGGNAYDEFIALRTRFPQAEELSTEQQRIAFALIENTRTALAANDVDGAAAFLTRADIVVPGMATTKALQDQLGEARRKRDFMKNIVPAGNLRRLREVAPVYPREAQRSGTQGWVDVEFTINSDGTTQDLVVRNSEPQAVFDKSALDSVSRWRFNPIVRDGVPVAQRASLRVKFVLN